jgi:hypothetical protein
MSLSSPRVCVSVCLCLRIYSVIHFEPTDWLSLHLNLPCSWGLPHALVSYLAIISKSNMKAVRYSEMGIALALFTVSL